MDIHEGIVALVLMVTIIALPGCSALFAPASGNGTTSLHPSEMALQIPDLPDGYKKTDAGSIPASDNYPGIGAVKEGYQVSFSQGTTEADLVFVNQNILILPADRVDQAISAISAAFRKQGTPGEQLSDPGIGETSCAFRMEDSQKNEIYMIAFARRDVFEMIIMGGTRADYAVLKKMAAAAEARIA
jgi:hypothetical protein